MARAASGCNAFGIATFSSFNDYNHVLATSCMGTESPSSALQLLCLVSAPVCLRHMDLVESRCRESVKSDTEIYCHSHSSVRYDQSDFQDSV